MLGGEQVAVDAFTPYVTPHAARRPPHVAEGVTLLAIGVAIAASSLADGLAGEQVQDINERGGIDAAASIGMNVGGALMEIGISSLLNGQ